MIEKSKFSLQLFLEILQQMWVRQQCCGHTDGMTGRATGELSAPAFPCRFHRHLTLLVHSGKAARGTRTRVIIPSLSLGEPNASCAAECREELLTGRLVLELPWSCCPPPALITHSNSSKWLVSIEVALPQPQKLSGVQSLLSFTLQKAVV